MKMSEIRKVLFTKKINTKHLFFNNFLVESYEFVHIVPLDFKLPSSPFQHYIFTSQNAVKFVCNHHTIDTMQSIYAVGEKTQEKLLDFAEFQNIKIPPNKESAEGLILRIEEDNSDNFLYFCGRKRLQKLEQYFVATGKHYEIVEVYDTLFRQPSKIDTRHYEWLCFCSPSSVESYLQSYELLPHHKVLCIGTTTAKILENKINAIHIAPKASVEGMLKYLEEYYKNI